MKRSKTQEQLSEEKSTVRPPKNAPTISRREFIRYSTFALTAASFAAPLSGCGGGGGSGDGGSWANTSSEDELTINPNQVSPGRLLEIGCTDAPTGNMLPEDIYSVMVEIDGAVSYGLRPLYFGEDRIAVPIPPMVDNDDGTYFDARNLKVRLSVSGIEKGHAFLTVVQDESMVGNGSDLLALLNDTLAELAALNTDRETLFEDADLLALWDQMYTLTVDGVDTLITTIEKLYSDRVFEVTVIDGSTYQLLPDDMNLAESLLDHLNTQLPEGLSNSFLDAFPSTASYVIKGLTALLGYALPGAFLVMTRDRVDRAVCSGTVASLATALVPAACMCVTGNCMRLLTTSQAEPDWVARGVNWYDNLLKNLGHYALNDSMIFDNSENHVALRLLVTQDSIDLFEVLIGSLDDENQWSNHPWNHLPWNNVAAWNHDPWSHASPWSNDAWTNNPWSDNVWADQPWSHASPWSNDVWTNTPWSNWSNTPWSNWSNTQWNNFVNSGV